MYECVCKCVLKKKNLSIDLYLSFVSPFSLLSFLFLSFPFFSFLFLIIFYGGCVFFPFSSLLFFSFSFSFSFFSFLFL